MYVKQASTELPLPPWTPTTWLHHSPPSLLPLVLLLLLSRSSAASCKEEEERCKVSVAAEEGKKVTKRSAWEKRGASGAGQPWKQDLAALSAGAGAGRGGEAGGARRIEARVALLPPICRERGHACFCLYRARTGEGRSHNG